MVRGRPWAFSRPRDAPSAGQSAAARRDPDVRRAWLTARQLKAFPLWHQAPTCAGRSERRWPPWPSPQARRRRPAHTPNSIIVALCRSCNWKPKDLSPGRRVPEKKAGAVVREGGSAFNFSCRPWVCGINVIEGTYQNPHGGFALYRPPPPRRGIRSCVPPQAYRASTSSSPLFA